MKYAIAESLGGLKLNGMKSEYLSQSEQPMMETLPFDERLKLLIDKEASMRSDNKSKRLLHNAKLFEPGALLENIDFSPERKIDKAQIVELSSLQWQDRGENLLLFGATGSGKTFLASAFGYASCMKHRSVRCYHMKSLLEELASESKGSVNNKKLDALLKPDVLILDDFGMRKMDNALSLDFFDIVAERARNRKVFIIASQFPVRKWPDIFENRTAGDAIMDRIVRNANRIMLYGPSRRQSVAYREEWADYDREVDVWDKPSTQDIPRTDSNSADPR